MSAPMTGTSPAPSVAGSPGHLLELIRAHDGLTRGELLELTGLSRTTLFERLELLLGSEMVHECGQRGSGRGRPARLLRFDDRGRVIMAIDVGHTHGRISVCSLSAAPLAHVAFPLKAATSPELLLAELVTRGDRLLESLPESRVVGVGMGLPVPVQTGTGIRWPVATMPGWHSYPVTEHVRQAWGAPVFIENDARAIALGECSMVHDTEGSEVLVGVKYASGIGAGIVVDDHPLRGSSGSTGDIGHIRVSSHGPRCTCGRRGCLAAHASGAALLRDLRPEGVRSLDDLVERLGAGDRVVRSAVTAAASLVGRALADVVQTLNPRTVVLGGIVGRQPLVVREVSRQVSRHTGPRTASAVTVSAGRLGEEAATVGLCRLVMSHVYSPEQIDASLSQS